MSSGRTRALIVTTATSVCVLAIAIITMALSCVFGNGMDEPPPGWASGFCALAMAGLMSTAMFTGASWLWDVRDFDRRLGPDGLVDAERAELRDAYLVGPGSKTLAGNDNEVAEIAEGVARRRRGLMNRLGKDEAKP